MSLDHLAQRLRARATNPSRSIVSMAPSAAAHATGLPPNVPPSPPFCGASKSDARPTTAESGKAVGDRLRQADEIGIEIEMLAREHLPGPPEAGLHLVGDEDDAVLAREASKLMKERRGRNDEPALAEHRLDDHGGERARRHRAREKAMKRRDLASVKLSTDCSRGRR